MKTAEQVKSEMARRGETASGWAKRHGVSAETVRGVLLGRIKGRNGEAHRVAVLLGIKEGVIVEGDGHGHS